MTSEIVDVKAGEIVDYHGTQGRVLAAMVAYVHPDDGPKMLPLPAIGKDPYQPEKRTLVNLMVLMEDGQTMNKLKVPFVGKEETAIPSGYYCRGKA